MGLNVFIVIDYAVSQLLNAFSNSHIYGQESSIAIVDWDGMGWVGWKSVGRFYEHRLALLITVSFHLKAQFILLDENEKHIKNENCAVHIAFKKCEFRDNET